LILNLPTLLLLFVLGLLGLLGALLAVLGGSLSLSPGHEEIPGEPPPGWRRSADAALGLALRSGLLLSLLALPLLYLTLASYVGRIPGSMCVYGVTQRATVELRALELGLPLSLFLLGLVLLLQRLDVDSPGAPHRQQARGAAFLAGAALVWATLRGFAYLLAEKGGAPVSCCTTVQQLAPGPGFFQYLGFTLPQGEASLLPSLLAAGGTGLGLLLAGWLGSRLRPRALRPVGLALGLAALGNAALFLQALGEGVAPRVLGLPFHHCPYCLMADLPDTTVAVAAAALSLACALWAAWVSVFSSEDSAESRRLVLTLWRSAALLLFGSVALVLFHLSLASLR